MEETMEVEEEMGVCEVCGEEFAESDLTEGSEVGRPGNLLCDDCLEKAYKDYPYDV